MQGTRDMHGLWPPLCDAVMISDTSVEMAFRVKLVLEPRETDGQTSDTLP